LALRVLGLAFVFAGAPGLVHAAAPATPTPTAAVVPAPAARKPPASPPLSPAAELASFTVVPGFRVELVAAEPLVEAPVAMAFDADGRLFVVEMRDFMPDAEGRGEERPNGRVSVLSDRDGDGRLETRTTFMEGLQLPRSIAFVAGGVLIAAPPNVYFCADADHDDHCDEPRVVATDYGTHKNPEHDANGLVPAIDNWLYNANLGLRHRFVDGRLLSEPTLTRGQWGIAQDDSGRLVFNANSDYLRGDQLPVFVHAGHLRATRGQNMPLDEDQTVWPGRPNYGVNRGYKDGSLRADGTLAQFTAACGPTVYRGEQFPPEYRGNAFVAEPAANLVRRSLLEDDGESVRGRNAYAAAHTEFLTSQDERFRPVNLTTGPDGALYIADFYRGLIQHRIYLTPFLRQQVIERGLDRPIDRGRIFRVVSTTGPALVRPGALSRASGAELVGALAHENGWRRDTAQRLLVERGRQALDAATTAALGRLARGSGDPRARLHALFALDGLGLVTPALMKQVAAAPGDANRFVRLAGTALLARGAEAKLVAFVQGLAARASQAGDKAGKPSAALPSLGSYRALDVLQRLLDQPGFAEAQPARAALLQGLATRVMKGGKPDEVLALLELVAAEPRASAWRQVALLDGVGAGKSGERAALPARAAGWSKLVRSGDGDVRARAVALSPWLGEEISAPAPNPARARSEDEKARFARGKALYPGICGACHQPSGLGEEGKGPPLVDSPWVLGTTERLVRIALHGLRGPVKVGARTFTMDMPAMGGLPDAQLAELLTYVRGESDWGHDAAPVDEATVARIRQGAAREEQWTEEELLKVR
jgi:glucose/arabinose dehydrogenase/mono/diheme cytochrome c family protein